MLSRARRSALSPREDGVCASMATGTFRATLRAQQACTRSAPPRLSPRRPWRTGSSLALLGLLSDLPARGIGGRARTRSISPAAPSPRPKRTRRSSRPSSSTARRLLERNVEGLLRAGLARSTSRTRGRRAPTTTTATRAQDGAQQAPDPRPVDALRDRVPRHQARGNRAEVEVFLDGSFELSAKSGDRYRRVNDYHRFILEQQPDEKWRFLSGM